MAQAFVCHAARLRTCHPPGDHSRPDHPTFTDNRSWSNHHPGADTHARSPTNNLLAASSTWAAVLESKITARLLSRSRAILLVNPPVRPFLNVTRWPLYSRVCQA